ncbi:hypothetical protein M413DRAFT_446162 [Hebeloma cylindrosporum]|uniref:Uncharacterized protein n=1 Tax=Hebeloma cylindrosporum TaxID=76867 RepID=A0A0C3C980_HEBCY|nr:hypothetical protein M413DRAFT_446162 [Hebeloma cylindrosporum h7]
MDIYTTEPSELISYSPFRMWFPAFVPSLRLIAFDRTYLLQLPRAYTLIRLFSNSDSGCHL